MIINQSNLSTLFKSFLASFKRGMMSRQDEQEWQRIATLAPSNTKTNEYGWLGQFPSLRKWVGERQVKNLEQHGYSIKNEKYEATVGVDRDDVEDDNLGVYTPVFQEMGVSAGLWPNEVVYALIALGETELCYDKKPFFATDHPENGTTASNLLGSGGTAPWYLLDTSRALKPFIFQRRAAPEIVNKNNVQRDDHVFFHDEFLYGARARGAAGFGFWQMALKHKGDLDQVNFDAAMTAMGQRVNDEGQTMGIRPDLLVVPWSLRSDAKALLQKEYLANGESNYNYDAIKVLITNYLPNA